MTGLLGGLQGGKTLVSTTTSSTTSHQIQHDPGLIAISPLSWKPLWFMGSSHDHMTTVHVT